MSGTVLINPPFELPERARASYLRSWPPLGLAYVAAALRDAGQAVQILDAVGEQLSVAQVVARIQQGPVPAVIGMTVMAATCGNTLALARACGELEPKPLIVLGGSHATHAAQELVCRPEVDAVVLSEGEVTAVELVTAWVGGERDLSGIPGLALCRDGRPAQTAPRPLVPDLDDLPWPARELLPMERYRQGDGRRIATLVTSRGCPYRCIYCCEPGFWQGRWRCRSAGDVVDEMADLAHRYQPDQLLILDDVFTLNLGRAHRICEEIIERGLSQPWGCQSRVDRVDADLLRHLRAAGCTSIGFGVESGLQEILDRIQRDTTLEETCTSIRAAQEEGLRTIGYFMLGLPGETAASMEATVSFACSLGLDEAWFSAATPYPGTEMAHRAGELGLKVLQTDWTSYDFTTATCTVEGLDPVAIQTKVREAYQRFYRR